MNILVTPLPETVDVAGVAYRIATGYRVGIQVARAVERDDLAPEMAAAAILKLYFRDDIPKDVNGALDAALEFHRCGRPISRRRSRQRVWDWDYDAPRLLADFRREYGIDLADPSTRMHWWVFWAYFEGLSQESDSKQAMAYRGRRPKGMGKEETKRYDAIRRAYALPEMRKAEEDAFFGD